MDYKKQLVEKIEKFYVEIIEEFKEAELQIIADSNFRSIFKKKDYGKNISMLKNCKKQVLKIDVSNIGIPKSDKEASEVVLRLERCIVNFRRLCDSYVQLQEALKRKSDKETVKYSEYKEIFNKVQEDRKNMNDSLHELDIVYTDYTYDEDYNPYTFLD